MDIPSNAVEFIGTFIFVSVIMIGTAKAKTNELSVLPLAIGIVLAAMIYWGSTTSGGHFNPVVTTAMMLRNPEDLSIATYIGAQLAGGVLAYYFSIYTLEYKL